MMGQKAYDVNLVQELHKAGLELDAAHIRFNQIIHAITILATLPSLQQIIPPERLREFKQEAERMGYAVYEARIRNRTAFEDAIGWTDEDDGIPF